MAGYPPPPPPMPPPVWRGGTRRRSIVGPLFLVALGFIFLLAEMGRVNWSTVADWYGHWWPLLLILAGVLLVAEWFVDQATQKQRIEAGLPVAGPRRLGGGVIWLMVLIGAFGVLSSRTHFMLPEINGHFPFGRWDFLRALGDPHDSDDVMAGSIPADGSLTIDNPNGDVTVSGTSDDGQLHIAIHKQVYALNDSDAATKSAKIQPVLGGADGHVTVRVPAVDHGQADLTIEVPRTVTLTVTANHGDVRVSGLHASVVVNGDRGSVDLSGLEGEVVAHMHSDSAALSAHSITGGLTVDGRTGDINVSDIHGAVSLSGNYSGTTHMERIAGPVRFHTHRTDFQMARLDGEVEFDTGDDLHGDQILGPVVLKTSERNITLERVQGDIHVADSNGSVVLTSASPLGAIDVVNRRGSVDVGVPAGSGFVVHAATKHGDVENDFALVKQGEDEHPELNGTVGHGGPTVHIETSDGDVTVRKSTVAALPPAAPTPPKITVVTPPAPPAPPTTGKAPKAPRPPKASKAPETHFL